MIVSTIKNEGIGICGNLFSLFNHILMGVNSGEKDFYCDWSGNNWFNEEPGKNSFEIMFKNKKNKDKNAKIKSGSDFKYNDSIGWVPRALNIKSPLDNKQLQYVDIIRTNFNLNFDINDNIQKEIDLFYNTHLKNKKVLGAHLRGADLMKHNGLSKNYSKNNGHKFYPEYYIPYLKKEMEKYNYDKIFVATDDETVLNSVIKEFGDKIIYYKNNFRISTTNALKLHQDPLFDNGKFDWMFKNSRKNHIKKLNIETMLDALTLSKCNSLLCSISSVSCVAQIFNNNKYNNVSFAFNTEGEWW